MFPGILDSRSCWSFVLMVGGMWPLSLYAQDEKKDKVQEIEARAVLYAKDNFPYRLVMTADNKTIVSACQAFGGVRFWDVDKKAEQPRQPGHTGRGVFGLALSPDGKTVASGGFSDRKVFLWNVASGKTTKELGEHKERVIAAQFTPDGKKLLTTSQEGDIKIWDVESGKETGALFGRIQNIGQVELSPDGKLLALMPGTRGATVTLWDVARDRAVLGLENLPANQGLGPVRFTPDGKQVAVVWGNTEPKLGFWDVATGKPARSIKLPRAEIHTMVFSPDGKRVAASGTDIRLWDIETGKAVVECVGHTGRIEALTFSADGKTLVSGGRDQRIRIWDIPTVTPKPPEDEPK